MKQLIVQKSTFINVHWLNLLYGFWGRLSHFNFRLCLLQNLLFFKLCGWLWYDGWRGMILCQLRKPTPILSCIFIIVIVVCFIIFCFFINCRDINILEKVEFLSKWILKLRFKDFLLLPWIPWIGMMQFFPLLFEMKTKKHEKKKKNGIFWKIYLLREKPKECRFALIPFVLLR